MKKGKEKRRGKVQSKSIPVSQYISLYGFPAMSVSTLVVSIPCVTLTEGSKFGRVKRHMSDVFPTSGSPTSRNFTGNRCLFSAMLRFCFYLKSIRKKKNFFKKILGCFFFRLLAKNLKPPEDHKTEKRSDTHRSLFVLDVINPELSVEHFLIETKRL